MPLLKKNQIFGHHFVHGLKHYTNTTNKKRGYGIMTPIVDIAKGALSSLFHSLPFGKISAVLGGLGASALSAYGIKKLVDKKHEKKMEPKKINLSKHPELNPEGLPYKVKSPKEGTLTGDLLPVTNTLDRMDPMNSAINLPDGVKALNGNYIQTPMMHTSVMGMGMKKHGRGSKKQNLEAMLSNKSKDILHGLVKRKM